jgi:signal transduction histidine kinase
MDTRAIRRVPLHVPCEIRRQGLSAAQTSYSVLVSGIGHCDMLYIKAAKVCKMSMGGNSRSSPRARAPSPASLSAAIVHEINNPLETLLNLLYLLEHEALTEKGCQYLRLAEEEVNRISQIARAALDGGATALMSQETNVNELLTAVLEFYKQRLDSLGIVVQSRHSCDGNIPAFAEQLRRVFSNLLLNAVEAMPEGGKLNIRVSAGHEWCGDKRSGVRVTIADTGTGIHPGMLPQLFERPFTTKSGGHGLGLQLVKDIVQHQHKGWLRVKSSTQPRRHGTVFSLFLPAA